MESHIRTVLSAVQSIPHSRYTVPRALTRTAQVVSSVFSPLLVPSYCTIIALWTTVLISAPEKARFNTAIVVLALTCFVPLAVMLALVKAGKIADTRVRLRRQRVFLYPVALVCYCVCAIFVVRVHAPGWLAGYFLGAALATLVAFVINFWWKISAHGIAIGGLLGMLFVLDFNSLNRIWFMPWISVAIVLAGLVASSRLVLKAHTPLQVYAGWALGLVSVMGMMAIFMS